MHTPVNLKINHASTVPKQISSSICAFLTSSIFSVNHIILDKEKYVATGNPVFSNSDLSSDISNI